MTMTEQLELLPTSNPNNRTQSDQTLNVATRPKKLMASFDLETYLQSTSALMVFIGFVVLSIFVVSVEKARFMLSFTVEDFGIILQFLMRVET